MDELPAEQTRNGIRAARLGLVAFVLVWLFGPGVLRSNVPVWLPFIVAVGLELHFFAGGLLPSGGARRRPDRGPQEIDRERYGYPPEPDEDPSLGEDDDDWPRSRDESATADEEDDEVGAREDAEADGWEEWQPEPWPRRRIRQLVVGLGVIGALVIVVWLAEGRGGWKGLDAEARAEAARLFSAEAGRIAGHSVSIECDESGDHVGVVQHADGAAEVGGRRGYLTPQRCHDLYRLAFEGEYRFSQTARSLAVLAHEAWHLQGVRDEGVTECYALQSGAELGVRLGLDEDTAQRMMRSQLVANAGRGDLEYLVPGECRDGGELDLRPDTSVFP